MAQHIDFKHVRDQADFATVLAAYDIQALPDGHKADQLKALCPFHEDTKPSLKVNTARNIFNCFACGAGGNILEFVRDMEGLGENELRNAATTLADMCGIDLSAGKPTTLITRQSHATGICNEIKTGNHGRLRPENNQRILPRAGGKSGLRSLATDGRHFRDNYPSV